MLRALVAALLCSVVSLSYSDPFIIVEKSTYTMEVDVDGYVETQKVIIGKPGRETPEMVDMVTHVVVNPRWSVPARIGRVDLVPQMKKNPSMIEAMGYEFYADHQNKIQLEPGQIDWGALTTKTKLPFYIVQRPGPNNALGSIKFVLTNDRSIYLHGTNHPELFVNDVRAFSSGCIRLEDPVKLANALLPTYNIEAAIAKKKEVWIKVSKPVPVIITDTITPDTFKALQ